MRPSTAIFGCLWLIGACAAASNGRTILLKVMDEHGKTAGARVRILNAQDQPVPVQAIEPSSLVAAHPNFPELGAIIARQARLAVPEGSVTVLLDRGPEYLEARLHVAAGAGEDIERTVTLDRWTDLAAKGWWSGDLHWAPAITCFNDTRILAEWPSGKLMAAGPLRLYSVDNCEDERRWGAALFIGVKSPMTLYPRITEYPSPVETWREARKRGAYIDLEKVVWWESPVMAALMPPDSIGVAVNHFLEDSVSTRASLARPRDENRYAGAAGFARYIFDLYATYLSAGFRIAASAGSANGVSRNVLGYNRSYVYLGSDFSAEAWLRGQKAGRNFVTNGPMLAFSVDGQLPGSVLPDSSAEVLAKLDCESRSELDRAELVLDGESAGEFRAQPGSSRIHAARKVKPRAGSWIFGRCFEKNQKTVRFAQSSPIYFGQIARQSAAAKTYLRNWVDAGMLGISPVPADLLTAGQRDELLEFCRKARERYQ